MNAHNNAAREAVQAEPCPNLDELPMDVHEVFQQQERAGFDRDLALSAYEVQNIASRLRGISAISALLMAAGDRDTLKLGEWIEGGLTEALHALAQDAHAVLELRNERTRKGAA